MTHNEIYEKFKEKFSTSIKKVKEWFPNGYGSIRIRMEDMKEYVFEYDRRGNWSYEPLEHYMERMKGKKE